jgi:hypothetical protein
MSAASECSVWLVDIATKDKRLLVSEHTSNIYLRDWSSNSHKVILSISPSPNGERTEKVYDIYTKKMQEFPKRRVYFITNSSYPDGAFLQTEVIDLNRNSYSVFNIEPLDGRQKKQIYP